MKAELDFFSYKHFENHNKMKKTKIQHKKNTNKTHCLL